MAKLVWDTTGEHFYETGTDKGVLFVMDDDGNYGNGVVWNGLTAVTESPEGAEVSDLYADNIKYLSLVSTETYGATIEAYSSPVEFDVCDGAASLATGVKIGQQTRKKFGFTWQTKKGNDVLGDEYGYLIHIFYNGLASPSEKSYATINDSPEAITLSWEISTTPVNVEGYKPTASVTIDSTLCDAEKLATFEGILYGSDDGEARLPLPEEIMSIFNGEQG